MADTHFTSPSELTRLDDLLWIGHETPHVKDFVMDRWEQLQKPPEPYSETLVRMIADYEGVSPNQVWALNSRWESLQLVTQFLGPQNGMLVKPSPLEYTSFFQNARIKPLYTDTIFPFTQFTGVQGCILSNPNIWHGQMYYSDELEDLISANPQCVFIIDERTMPFTEVPDSLSPQTAYMRNLIVLRSVEDRYGLPGLGLSYALGHPKLISGLKTRQNPHSVSGLAQLSGLAIFQNPDHPAIDTKTNIERRQSLEKALQKLPALSIPRSYTHYLALSLPGVSAQALASYLEESAQVRVFWEGEEALGTSEIIRIKASEGDAQENIFMALQHLIQTREAQETEK